MLLEPLENRTLLAAELLDDAGDAVEQGGGADWVDELVSYEDLVGPTDNQSITNIYGALTDTPLNWQDSLSEAVSTEAGGGIDSTADVVNGGDASYSIQNLAEASSVELVDGQVAGLPAGAVEIASSIEQLNTMADANSSGMSAIASAQSSVIVSTGDGLLDDAADGGESDSDTEPNDDTASYEDQMGDALEQFALSQLNFNGIVGTTLNLTGLSTYSDVMTFLSDHDGTVPTCESQNDDHIASDIITVREQTLVAIVASNFATAVIDLSGANTATDIVNTINSSGSPVVATLEANGHGFNVTDPTNGPGQLELFGLNEVQIIASDGTNDTVDFTGASTAAQIVGVINSAMVDVVATLHADGKGFEVIDLTNGPGELTFRTADEFIYDEVPQDDPDPTDSTCHSGDGDGDGDGDGGFSIGGDPVFTGRLGPGGTFSPVDSPRNFTRTTTTMVCEEDDSGSRPDTCASPLATVTHTVTQVFIDDDHWMFTETIVGSFNFTESVTDELGGVLTVIATGSFNVSFAAAEGIGPAAGGRGQSLSLITSGSGSLTVTYDLVHSDPSEVRTTVESNVNLFFNTTSNSNSGYSSIPTRNALGEPGRTISSNGSFGGGSSSTAAGGWSVVCGEGDVAAGDGWTAWSGGSFNSNSNSNGNVHWDVTQVSGGGTPTDFSGDAGFSIGGGGGGSSNSNSGAVIKAKEGDYDAGNGWKASLDWGNSGSSGGSSNVSMAVEGDFATNADGKVETTLTTNEFEIGFNANSGGGGHNNASYNSKSDSSTNTTNGYWTYVGNSDSTYDEWSDVNSSGNFSIEFSLSKETGDDDASGSVDLTFDGTAGDGWHIFDEHNSDWTNTYNDGAGNVEIYTGDSTSLYTVDEVYSSRYDGDPSVTLGDDGPSESGSVSSGEEYSFDQVSSYDDEWSEDITSSGGYDDGMGMMYSWSNWDLWDYEYRNKVTDHYYAQIGDMGEEEGDEESESESDAAAADGADDDSSDDSDSDEPTEEGWTEYETFYETCHTWDYHDTSGHSDTGGPDCSTSSSTIREDWESLIDQAMAEMAMEEKMGDTGDTPEDEGGDDGGCMTCAEGGEEEEEKEHQVFIGGEGLEKFIDRVLNPDSKSTTVTLKPRGMILILRGHGAESATHHLLFHNSFQAACFIGCDAGATNKLIDPLDRLPNAKMTDGTIMKGGIGARHRRDTTEHFTEQAIADARAKAVSLRQACMTHFDGVAIVAGLDILEDRHERTKARRYSCAACTWSGSLRVLATDASDRVSDSRTTLEASGEAG